MIESGSELNALSVLTSKLHVFCNVIGESDIHAGLLCFDLEGTFIKGAHAVCLLLVDLMLDLTKYMQFPRLSVCFDSGYFSHQC